jgi:hypothetical protein
MKHISYYDIKKGSYPLFQAVEGIVPEIILDDAEWNQPRPFFGSHNPSIICVPTWDWDFASFLDLPRYLHQKMDRDGYYIFTGRRCDQETIYKSSNGKFQAYFSCFGMAYSSKPWIKNVHHWTSLEKNSDLPKWLAGWYPETYIITHVK